MITKFSPCTQIFSSLTAKYLNRTVQNYESLKEAEK